jgi:TrmH family RNA methyltransferase
LTGLTGSALDFERDRSYPPAMRHRRAESSPPQRESDERAAASVASQRNPVILRLRKWIARPERARREGVLVVEGRHAAREALDRGFQPILSLASDPMEGDRRSADLLVVLEARAETSLRVPADLMRRLSSDPSPQGILTVWRRPSFLTSPSDPIPGRRVLGLWGIQDPGNAGSLLRTAAAFGLETALVLPETADPFHPKVVRASAGAAFRMAYASGRTGESGTDVLGRWRDAGWTLLALDPRGHDRLAPGEPLPLPPWLLLAGSEGSGLPGEVLSVCARRFRIPMIDGMDSLGVAAAGAVALFALCSPDLPQ